METIFILGIILNEGIRVIQDMIVLLQNLLMEETVGHSMSMEEMEVMEYDEPM